MKREASFTNVNHSRSASVSRCILAVHVSWSVSYPSTSSCTDVLFPAAYLLSAIMVRAWARLNRFPGTSWITRGSLAPAALIAIAPIVPALGFCPSLSVISSSFISCWEQSRERPRFKKKSKWTAHTCSDGEVNLSHHAGDWQAHAWRVTSSAENPSESQYMWMSCFISGDSYNEKKGLSLLIN